MFIASRNPRGVRRVSRKANSISMHGVFRSLEAVGKAGGLNDTQPIRAQSSSIVAKRAKSPSGLASTPRDFPTDCSVITT